MARLCSYSCSGLKSGTSPKSQKVELATGYGTAVSIAGSTKRGGGMREKSQLIALLQLAVASSQLLLNIIFVYPGH